MGVDVDLSVKAAGLGHRVCVDTMSLLKSGQGMLVGNSNQISLSVFAPANTLASLLALNFPEAAEREVSLLMYAACILMLITLLVNIAGTAIISATGSGVKK